MILPLIGNAVNTEWLNACEEFQFQNSKVASSRVNALAEPERVLRGGAAKLHPRAGALPSPRNLSGAMNIRYQGSTESRRARPYQTKSVQPHTGKLFVEKMLHQKFFEKCGSSQSFPSKILLNFVWKRVFRTRFRRILFGKDFSRPHSREFCSDKSFPDIIPRDFVWKRVFRTTFT